MEYLPYYSHHSIRRPKVACLAATATLGVSIGFTISQAHAATTTTTTATTTTTTTEADTPAHKIIGVSMVCYPRGAATYDVHYRFDLHAGFVIPHGRTSGRLYDVIDFENNPRKEIIYVAMKSPEQSRTINLAFDYSGAGRDVSAVKTVDGLDVKRDSCKFDGTY